MFYSLFIFVLVSTASTFLFLMNFFLINLNQLVPESWDFKRRWVSSFYWSPQLTTWRLSKNSVFSQQCHYKIIFPTSEHRVSNFSFINVFYKCNWQVSLSNHYDRCVGFSSCKVCHKSDLAPMLTKYLCSKGLMRVHNCFILRKLCFVWHKQSYIQLHTSI